ncbi:MAG: P1 family peptidase [Sediminibacterium sp.]|nr:P1 family peptidase [Sediminibacterium sp.]
MIQPLAGLTLLLALPFYSTSQDRGNARDLGIRIGVMQPGKLNSITDVSGVKVGHTTLIKDRDIRTGVTAIIPAEGNLFQQKIPAAVYTGNGFGKLAGSTQVNELGNLETPIVLTNTLNVSTAMDALIEYTLTEKGNEKVASVNAYTIGVLVQSNFGGVLQINGVPVGEKLGKFSFSNQLLNNVDGSCMIVVATDAPIDHRNLMRIAKRAMLGLGKTGGIASNGSGDYVIAFSTAPELRVPHDGPAKIMQTPVLLNDEMSPLFMATIEATEEAIINFLFNAKTTTGRNGNTAEALPLNKVLPLFKKQ